MLLIGLRLCGVLADDVQRVEFASFHRGEHVAEMPAPLAWKRGVPGRLELSDGDGIFDILSAQKLVGNRSHVAAALHVVLPSQRIETRAVSSDMTAEQRQIDECSDVVDRIVMLGDPEGPTERGLRSARIGYGELANKGCRDAGRLFRVFQRVRLDGHSVFLKAVGGSGHEVAVLQSGGEDLPADGVGQRYIGADVEAEPAVGPASARRLTGIDDVQLRAVANAAQDVVKKDRMRLARVRPP